MLRVVIKIETDSLLWPGALRWVHRVLGIPTSERSRVVRERPFKREHLRLWCFVDEPRIGREDSLSLHLVDLWCHKLMEGLLGREHFPQLVSCLWLRYLSYTHIIMVKRRNVDFCHCYISLGLASSILLGVAHSLRQGRSRSFLCLELTMADLVKHIDHHLEVLITHLLYGLHQLVIHLFQLLYLHTFHIFVLFQSSNSLSKMVSIAWRLEFRCTSIPRYPGWSPIKHLR